MSTFKGKNTHRFLRHPLEKKIAKAWEKENDSEKLCRGSVLQYILSDDGGKTLPETSERDEMIAASVIQWLGSSVGQSFLSKIYFMANRDLTIDAL